MGSMFNSHIMLRYSAFNPYRLLQKELGFPTPISASEAMARSLYCGMKPTATWDADQALALPTGGVFNLEFSPEGSLLVAACEKKSIQIFDPLTHQRIYSVNGAHSDCVNCVKFLDDRMFATCSDDTTIALWDVRNLKKKIRDLTGHSNWVKNIEYSVKDKLLVTCGLDGSIYTWDINLYTERNCVYSKVFNAPGLMRCRLSPDARQMVMCTTGGLLVLIHNLNLNTLAKDLHGFKSNLYRLMQMSQQVIPIAAMYDHLFDLNRKENRVEFVSDFPEGNEAQVVSALQIHPQGWTALSRNISQDDKSEWSCIHDIQPDAPPLSKACRDTAPPPPRRLRPRAAAAPRRALARPWARAGAGPAGAAAAAQLSPRTPSASPPGPSRSEPSPQGSTAPATATVASAGSSRLVAPSLSSIQNDVWEASISIRQHRGLQEMASRGQVGRNFNMQRITGINTGIAPPPPPPPRPRPRPVPTAAEIDSLRQSMISPSTSGRTPADAASAEDTPVRGNRDRLLYYIEETNEGKGFIKEQCYSSDGRVICSPFGRGMRLLALDSRCSELSHVACDPSRPQPLHELGQSLGMHPDLVVSAKFSPRHHLLVTGCLDGKIVWYQPYSGEMD